ncbi:hypothetical protein [Pseudorhodoferax sp. Leaf274]|uniref:hypothetical protein n=1 Tax=Pseudorhodoferax sp. Leaf274 TaxID=1736318 RepID=UPI0012E0D33F|nr:hypothetical protein [Pseudorhodoferax sp. Leaf274]
MTVVASRCRSMRMSAATGEASGGISKGENLGVGVVPWLTVYGSLAAVPSTICAPTSASLTHQRTRFALMPFAMVTDADDTPGWQHAATIAL